MICSFMPDRDDSLKVQKALPAGCVYISETKGDDAHIQNGPNNILEVQVKFVAAWTPQTPFKSHISLFVCPSC